MFNNSPRALRVFAVINLVVGLIISVFLGIYLWVTSTEENSYAFIFMIILAFNSLLTSFLIAGFAALIENSEETAFNTREMKALMEKNDHTKRIVALDNLRRRGEISEEDYLRRLADI